MGEYADGYEKGLWDQDGIPSWDDEYNDYSTQDNKVYDEIVIDLTPSQYLSEYSKFLRLKLFNKTDKVSNEYLHVYHDKFNDHDKYALEIYYQDKTIGYVRKNGSAYYKKGDIEDFCFTNGILNDLKLKYDGKNLKLIKELSYLEIEQKKVRQREEQERLKNAIYKREEKEKERLIRERQKQRREQEEENIRRQKKRDADGEIFSKAYDNPTMLETVKNVAGLDSSQSLSKRTLNATMELDHIDKPNIVYSTIDFFGGDSEKMKEEQRQEIIDKLEHPIRHSMGNFFTIIFLLFIVVSVIMGLLS